MPRYVHKAPPPSPSTPLREGSLGEAAVLLGVFLDEINVVRQACGLSARTAEDVQATYLRLRAQASAPEGRPA